LAFNCAAVRAIAGYRAVSVNVLIRMVLWTGSLKVGATASRPVRRWYNAHYARHGRKRRSRGLHLTIVHRRQCLMKQGVEQAAASVAEAPTL
jgi:hypothetical protein